jgi:methionyl-tRNA synthetase
VASEPFVPGTARRLRACFDRGLEAAVALDAGARVRSEELVVPGAPLTPPGLLFRKLDADELAAWTERFGGGPGVGDAAATAAPAATGEGAA